jgi:CRISPR/Cas system CMR-associated protein Cmr5 small subunit
MENLEQRRAANALARALECRKRDGEGDCLSGYPGLIINNGLLACLAFSLEKEGQHERVANAIAWHLGELDVCRYVGPGHPNAAWLLRHLCSADVTAHRLRRATDEALVFLGYLKRFVKTSIAEPKP